MKQFNFLKLSELILRSDENDNRIDYHTQQRAVRKHVGYTTRVKTLYLTPILDTEIPIDFETKLSIFVQKEESLKELEVSNSVSQFSKIEKFSSVETFVQRYVERVQEEGSILLKNLEQHLEMIGINCNDLIHDRHILNLELFDNMEYEFRPISRLMDENKSHNIVSAFAFISSTNDTQSYQWEVVNVIEYFRDKNLFVIRSLDGTKRRREVSRLLLMFRNEDPKLFSHRLQFAVNLRKMSIMRLKYEYFLDNVPPTYSTETCFEYFAEDICKKVPTNSLDDKITSELNYLWNRFLTDLLVRSNMTKNDEIYKFLERPDIENITTLRYNFIRNQKEVFAKNSFEETKKKFHWYNLYVETEICETLKLIYHACVVVSQINLFRINFEKPLSLVEFENEQCNNIDQIITYLKEDWTNTLLDILEKNLKNLGKGWFNMKVNNWNIYKISKMSRLMTLILLHMENAVRNLVLKSANEFTNLLEAPCLSFLKYLDSYELDSDSVNPNYINKMEPIFSVVLQMNQIGTYYSTDLDEFSESFISHLDNGIRYSHEVKQIDQFVLKNLKFDKNLTLSSIGLLDARIEEFRIRIRSAYNDVIQPMMTYLQKYNKYTDFYNLDVDKYIEQFVSQNHSAIKVREEISMHLKNMKHLETTIPNSIIMGPFLISVELLRSDLINKRKLLIDNLLRTFAERMNKFIEELLVSYESYMLKLNEKATTIEEIVQLKASVDLIPNGLKSNEDLMKRYLYEYEVLDYFWCPLSDQDFENKWQALTWPYKIRKQLELTNEFLASEIDNLYKIQKSNETELNENIDQLCNSVNTFITKLDINQAIEYADEVEILWQSILEAQEYRDLLNKRQDLFHASLTPFEKIDELFSELAPYRNFWSTYADWLKSYDNWMEHPLFSLEVLQLENELDNFKTIFKKLIHIFKENPNVQSVINGFLNEISQFEIYVELLRILTDSNFSQSHWSSFCRQKNISAAFDSTLNFKVCQKIDIVTDVISLKNMLTK